MTGFGRTESIPPKEYASQLTLARERDKVKAQLEQAHRYALLISDPQWQHYRDYMVREVLRPAEEACRTLNPFKDQETLLRNQVTAEIIRRIIEEPQMRARSTVIEKLQEKLNTLKTRLGFATK